MVCPASQFFLQSTYSELFLTIETMTISLPVLRGLVAILGRFICRGLGIQDYIRVTVDNFMVS